MTVLPEEIYIVHHSHTDIGFTAPQPAVWDLHERFIDMAIEYAERDLEHDAGAFRWTCECFAPVVRWFQNRSDKEIERFLALEKAGRIEVTGMFLIWAPLYDRCQLEESMEWVWKLRRDYGITIRSAMASDVNGQAWPIVDAFLDAGIEHFSMAINTHHGRALQKRPEGFRWTGPSGRELLAWNGMQYGYASWTMGVGTQTIEEVRDNRLPQVAELLDAAGYDLPVMMFQGIHTFGDNAPPMPSMAAFIRLWNAAGLTPRLRCATLSQWFDALAPYRDRLESRSGEWSDFWNFGACSSAFETAVARTTLARIEAADAFNAVAPVTSAGRRSYERYRPQAWWNLHVWTEHTWTASNAAEAPDTEDAASFWNHKANTVWTAHSLSWLLQRDAIVRIADGVTAQPGDVVVFNPLPWEVTVDSVVAAATSKARGGPLDDNPSSLALQDRKLDVDPASGPAFHGGFPQQYPRHVLAPVSVPGFGYRVIPQMGLVDVKETRTVSDERLVTNHRHALRFDALGHLASWRDNALDCEWVDARGPSKFAQYVHEEVAVRDHPWPRAIQFAIGGVDAVPGMAENDESAHADWPALRRPMERLVSHKVERFACRTRVEQQWEAPGIEGLLTRRILLPDYADWVQFDLLWTNGVDPHPQGQYVVFPFAMTQPVPTMDVGSAWVNPLAERLPGSCADYFTSQGWVDLGNAQRGMTIANTDNPVFMLDGFHFCAMQDERQLESGTFIGWITNNYWTCNFPASQPGRVRCRYRMLPRAHPLRPQSAMRLAAETRVALAPMQYASAEKPPSGRLPDQGTFLQLPDTIDPEGDARTIQVKPDPSDFGRAILVKVLNTGGKPVDAAFAEGLLRASRVRLLADDREPDEIAINGGRWNVRIDPCRIATLSIEFEEKRPAHASTKERRA